MTLSARAKLFGLVLSGGKSTRMGADKGLIVYHDLPQREHLYQLLQQVCDESYLSLRKDQGAAVEGDYRILVDNDDYRGPFNGLLSAHKAYPDAAWLVLACDLPLLDLEALRELVAARDTSKMATAFALREHSLPEPLCAIWEPQGLRNAIGYLEAGNGTCPRKFLINSAVQLVYPARREVLLNANSQEEYEEAMALLAKQ
jgi:molybdenum cofactor guanylyltransferase